MLPARALASRRAAALSNLPLRNADAASEASLPCGACWAWQTSGAAGAANHANSAMRKTTLRSGRAIFRLHLDADRFEKGGRQDAAGADNDDVVPQGDLPAFAFHQNVLASDRFDFRFQHEGQCTAPDRGFDACAVLGLCTAERLAPVGQRHSGIGLFGNAGCSFERAVTAADHQHMGTAVLFGIDEAIDDFRLLLSGDIELARGPAAANGEKDGAARIAIPVGPDDEARCRPLDRLDALAVADLEPGLGRRLSPEGEQPLLADFREAHAAYQGQHRRSRHDELATRVVRDGSTETLLLQGQKVELVGERRQAGGEARRPAAHYDDVEHAGPAEAVETSDRLDGLPALLDGVADQPHAPELSRNEESGNIGLKIGSDNGQLDAAGFGPEYQRDRSRRARRLAGAVTDAAGRLDQHGLAVNEAEDIALGACPGTGAAAQAFHRIDFRMQRGRLSQTRLGRLRLF